MEFKTVQENPRSEVELVQLLLDSMYRLDPNYGLCHLVISIRKGAFGYDTPYGITMREETILENVLEKHFPKRYYKDTYYHWKPGLPSARKKFLQRLIEKLKSETK